MASPAGVVNMLERSPNVVANENAARQAAVRALQALARVPRADVVDARSSMRTFCTIAHATGLRAEQAIVLLKESWALETVTRSVLRSDERVALLARAVTLCIDEYYASIDGADMERSRALDERLAREVASSPSLPRAKAPG